MSGRKCVFLDRDGVINEDTGYIFETDKFHLIAGVPEAIGRLKAAGYLLVLVTNQSGIARNYYTREQMHACHAYMQQRLNHQIDHIYYSPWHEQQSASLSRKPGSLMFEKAIARFGIDPAQSWMVGDKARDIQPAQKLGLRTIQVGGGTDSPADHFLPDLAAAAALIIGA